MFSKKKRWFWTSLFTSESVWDFSKRTLDSVCNYMFTMQVAKWLSSLKINDSTEFCVDDQIKTALMNFFFLTVGQMAPCMVKKNNDANDKKERSPSSAVPFTSVENAWPQVLFWLFPTISHSSSVAFGCSKQKIQLKTNFILTAWQETKLVPSYRV